MKGIILVLFSIIWTVIEAENKDIRIIITYNSAQNIYQYFHKKIYIVNENDLIFITVEVHAIVKEVRCNNGYRQLTMYYSPKNIYNNSTNNEYRSEAVTATFSISNIWSCTILYNTNHEEQCHFRVHVRSSRIPIIKINENELSARRPPDSVSDYDAEIEYKFTEGNLLRIDCNYNVATGMKFVYNGFGIGENNTYQPTEFIYENTSITSWIGMKSAHDNTCIDCVVRRDEYRNVVVRVRFVLRQELINTGVTVYGLKRSNILLQFYNGIGVDGMLYGYEERELLNLTWYLKPEEAFTPRHVLLKWKNEILLNSSVNTLTKTLASHVFSLSAADNWTVISCSARSEMNSNKELRIVLFPQQQSETKQTISTVMISGHLSHITIIPKIQINTNDLIAKPSNGSVSDYDGEIVYNFIEGEILHIVCSDDGAKGMKFVYNGFGIDENDTYQRTSFIYEYTSIHARVGMKSSHNNAYIDCVVKRNEYRNVVVRVRLLLKKEAAGSGALTLRVNGVKMVPEKAKHNVFTYIYMPREIINISCESNVNANGNLKIQYNRNMNMAGVTGASNFVSDLVDMTRYINMRNIILFAMCSVANSESTATIVFDKATNNHHGITVYGLRPSNILLRSQNEIDVNVIYYEYEDKESLNLTWFLNPDGMTKIHVRITWKDTVLEDTILNTSLSGFIASRVLSLGAGDSRTVINCSISTQLYWSKELRIVLFSSSQPFTDKVVGEPLSLGTILVIALACVICIGLIKVTLLIIRKGKNKTTRRELSETEVSNNETLGDRVNEQSPESLDGYVKYMTVIKHETTAETSNDPAGCLYSVPIPKCERVAVKNNKSVYGNVENSGDKLYTQAEVHTKNGQSNRIIDDESSDKNVNFDKEIYANVNNDKEIEMKLYCNVNLEC